MLNLLSSPERGSASPVVGLTSSGPSARTQPASSARAARDATASARKPCSDRNSRRACAGGWVSEPHAYGLKPSRGRYQTSPRRATARPGGGGGEEQSRNPPRPP